MWEKHGAAALEMTAMTDPSTFCKIMASILPRDIDINVDSRVEVAVSALEAYRLLKSTTATELRQIEKVIDAGD
jgi:hypothetical protein